MKYNVNEKKFYELKDLKEIKSFSYDFNHIETNLDYEKYLLFIEVEYLNASDEEVKLELKFPLELATNIEENLTADLINVDYEVKEKGIEVELILDVEVITFEEEKVIIKEEYQQELEDKLSKRNEEELPESIVKIEENILCDTKNLFSFLKTEYIKYKVLSLDEKDFDKLSLKYNLSLDFLYEKKKLNDKVIVYDN